MATKKVSKRKGKTRSGTTGRVVKKVAVKKKVGKKKATGRVARKPKAKLTPLQNALKVANLLGDIATVLKDQTPQEIKLIKEHFPRQTNFPRKSKDVIFKFKSAKLAADKERDITVTWRC